MKTKNYLVWMLIMMISMSSCEDFFNPDLGIYLEEKDIFNEFNDFRTAGLGLYGIQQQLEEQIFILGELRGDLLGITQNTNQDLSEIYNFSISPENEYASPENFYKLIANCNNLANKIILKKPEVTDPITATDNYDKLYGEVQCMRAWAYFNAARIYGKVPYIYPNIQSMDEIDEYINTGKTVIAEKKIIFDLNGYHNDTLRNVSVTYDKMYLDLDAIIDTFSVVLEDVKAVGVSYSIDNNDDTWAVTTWSEASRKALLSQMYLFRGDYSRAIYHLQFFLNNSTYSGGNTQYALDNKFSDLNWRNIFGGIDNDEHIFSVWYGRDKRQQNNLQYYFSNQGGNQYMLKPTPRAIQYWESSFNGFKLLENPTNPSRTFTSVIGEPGDFYRGYGVSYMYYKNGEAMLKEEVRNMLELKMEKRDRESNFLMNGVDTVVYKYSINKEPLDRDAFIPLYRAAGMHLYAAEIYAMWEFNHPGDVVYAEPSIGLSIANNGNYSNSTDMTGLGVRGRVGFGDGDEKLRVGNINYIFDPSTNEVTGYIDLTGDFPAKQAYAVELILDERVRELGFEGERFFDLMRVAKRIGNPAFLAEKVASKFNGSNRERIKSLLMNEENWYLKLPDK